MQKQLEEEKNTLQREFNQWKALPDKIGLSEHLLGNVSITDMCLSCVENRLEGVTQELEGDQAETFVL